MTYNMAPAHVFRACAGFIESVSAERTFMARTPAIASPSSLTRSSVNFAVLSRSEPMYRPNHPCSKDQVI